MRTQVEVSRHNVTVAQFFSAVRSACKKKGLDFGLERDIFESPIACYNATYFVRDGVKYARYCEGEPTLELDATDAPAKAETCRIKPYDYQVYVMGFDGSVFNEICEFTFDDENRGFGYYYQLSVEPQEA